MNTAFYKREQNGKIPDQARSLNGVKRHCCEQLHHSLVQNLVMFYIIKEPFCDINKHLRIIKTYTFFILKIHLKKWTK